jgi:hypothetical protein
MYLCYIDETGNRDPRLLIPQGDGTEKPGDWLYVLTALCIFEQRWHTLEKPINRRKLELAKRINRDTDSKLALVDCEIKSNWVRQPLERTKHPFLQHLNQPDITGLIDLYYEQLDAVHATIFSVLVDKRRLPSGTTQHDIHLRSWERLLELIERFMRARHRKHQAIMINDDVSRQANRMLAMSHAQLLDQGTRQDMWLRHICEMPMFVRSELSIGVQLVDLCSYNIYRAFRNGDPTYPFFQRIAPFIWGPHEWVPRGKPFSGIWVLGKGSPLITLVRQFEKSKPRPVRTGAALNSDVQRG